MEPIIGVRAKIVLQEESCQLQELELVRPSSAKELDLEHGQISAESPVGRALVRHKAGEEITVQTPAGERHYRILEVKLVDRASISTAEAHAARRRPSKPPGPGSKGSPSWGL